MVHLAGLTSLVRQGKSHYLQLSMEAIWINVRGKTILPKWFKAFPATHLSATVSGKRMIVLDGKLEKRYQITVPEQFINIG